LISEKVTNWSLSDQLHRVEIPVGVTHDSDPEKVIELLLRVVKAHPDVLAEPAPEALFVEYGDSALKFSVRCWALNTNWWIVRSQLLVQLKPGLDEAQLTLARPQTEIHVRLMDPLPTKEGGEVPPTPMEGPAS
jgi:small-conductance mechanosensitive channel